MAPEAVQTLTEYIMQSYVAGNRRCEFCASVLRSEDRSAPDELNDVLLAAFDEIDRTAHESGSGELLVKLADITIASSNRSALARGAYYLLEGFRLGNVSDEARFSAAHLLHELGHHEEARQLFQNIYEDQSSAFYQSASAQSWMNYLDGEIRRANSISDRFLALGETSNSLDEDYLPLYKHRPIYPADAERDGKEGNVVVEFTVGTDGRTKDIVVVSSTDPVFEDATLQAASRFLYMPEMVGGVPIERTGVRNRITFELPDG